MNTAKLAENKSEQKDASHSKERANTIKLHLSHKRHSVPIGIVVEEADVFLE
mgnify:CR=1 FL=1